MFYCVSLHASVCVTYYRTAVSQRLDVKLCREETDAPAVLKSARGSLGSVVTLSNEPFERGTGPVWNVSTEDLTAA